MSKNMKESVPKYDVKIQSIRLEGNLRATASVNIYGDFAVRSVKVMQGTNGLFVSMPSYRSGSDYKDVCFPCTKEAKAEFDKAVLDAYQQALAQGQAMANQQEDSAPSQDQPVMAGM